MRRRLLALVFAAILGVAAPPQRIVSTTPSITELLYALGLGDRVVGVTRFCRYPPEAQQKPKIGDYINPNLEAIAALRPDLVIIQTNPVRLAEKLASVRLRSVEVNQENIEAIYNSIRVIGEATETAPRAAALIDTIRKGLEEIRVRAASLPRVRMMFVVGRSPNRLDGLIVAGRASYLNEVIDLAGGQNVFRDAVAAYPAVSLEQVIARRPEIIIDMGDMSDTVGVSDEHKRAVERLWTQSSAATAIKPRRVFAVASDIFVVPGPRVVDAARAFFDMLHASASAPPK
ncbi:MAG TPA: helical backbone metal receptor [Bryobacteraceae bacterium]|nr:helical backbone metal receptor [Bryobacteraceae bacterium]